MFGTQMLRSAVAVDILTGFLGSGKTTLLRHALTHGLQGQPVAVIMNEIGEVGIDGRVITGLANVERIVELSNGCICCTIDDYRFDRAVQEILDTTNPHALIIETTGLADPVALAERVTGAGLRLDAIITVVDADVVASQLDQVAVVRRQIEAADFLVINKIDLLETVELDLLSKRLRQRNPRAEQMRTERGMVDTDLLFATGAARHRTHAATHRHDRPKRGSDGRGSRDSHPDDVWRPDDQLDRGSNRACG